MQQAEDGHLQGKKVLRGKHDKDQQVKPEGRQNQIRKKRHTVLTLRELTGTH